MPRILVIDNLALKTRSFRIGPFPKRYGNKEILKEMRKHVKGIGRNPTFLREKNSLIIVTADESKRIQIRFNEV